VIPGLKPTVLSSFLGKNTDDNTTKTAPEYLLIAKNVICQGDDTVKTCPGYTAVKTLAGNKVIKMFDWQRPSDKFQFLLVQHGGKLGALTPGGDGTFSAAEQVLSATESDSASFDFITNYFAAYTNNGINAYKLVDNAGTLTKYQWGISAPSTAPTLSYSAGALTLTFGKQYCYSFVSYITDAAGNQRMHIGPPSPVSAHTGPRTSQVVTLGSLEVSSDPQVTHKWIFSTVNTPFNTSSTYYFEAEITNATTSYGDVLTDSDLDTTRLAPFDNHPAPLGSIVVSYQNRAVVIDPETGLVQFSGFEEIDLGIPMEAFPSDLFFNPPTGTRKPTAAVVVDDGQTLLVGTEEAWTKLTGYNAQTFQMKERVVGPGPVGKEAVTRTPTHLCWVSRDKRIWAWDTRLGNITGIPAMPIEVSHAIQQRLTGPNGQATTYSMEDLKDTELSNSKLFWFAYGKHHYIVYAANTSDESTEAINWFQLWYVDYEDGTIKSVAETDFIPSDLFAACANVLVGSTPYLFFGSYTTGKIYRWPDTFLHDGARYYPVAGPAWSRCDFLGQKRFFWADCITDRTDSKDTFSADAVVSGAPNMLLLPTPLPIGPVQTQGGIDPMAFRANMQIQGTSFGQYMRMLIHFPSDGQQSTLKEISIYSKPVYDSAP
jgi:hypothetical protein